MRSNLWHARYLARKHNFSVDRPRMNVFGERVVCCGGGVGVSPALFSWASSSSFRSCVCVVFM